MSSYETKFTLYYTIIEKEAKLFRLKYSFIEILTAEIITLFGKGVLTVPFIQ